jgi:hypothetical protein
MRTLIVIAICLLVIGCDSEVPVERPAPFLEEEVFAAARIARVRILRVEPVRGSVKSPGTTCGYRNFVSVVDPIKGGPASFEVFTDVNKLKINHDYLIFAHQIASDRRMRSRIGDYVSPIEKKIQTCGVSDDGYYLPIGKQTYFEFDDGAAKQYGGAWLAPRDQNEALGFLWCNSDWPTDERIEKRGVLHTRDIATVGGMGQAVDWNSARLLITQALENSPLLWSFLPNPFFKPAAC